MRIMLNHGGTAAAAESFGGELVSLVDGGTEYIWCGDPEYWSGVNPLLFPVVGSTRGGVSYGGRRFPTPKHGIARKSEFYIVEQGGDYVVFGLEESEESLELYPFPFSLRVTHRLFEGGFSTSVRVENTGSTAMPFCLGAHTAFRCPIFPGEKFEDYDISFDHAETAETMLVTEGGCISHCMTEPFLDNAKSFPLDHGDYDRLDTVIFKGLKSGGVSLRHREKGHGVHVDYPGFPMIAFWSPVKKNAPFICIEPWHGCAALDNESGEFADKPFCITLQPGESKTLEYRVSIL